MTTENKKHASPAEQPPINHHQEQNRFALERDGVQLAHADYRREGDTLVFFRTYVPESQRGQGHAAKVVRAGLEYARNGDFRVVPTCSYVARFIDRHPQFKELLVRSSPEQ